ncbi:hypothetical protein FRX31_031630 [Thalictrum thalictroides]|uniref:Uncharacterized protein n=1 Tax=Thalictrum thalictroides TaxID=46969 RepID=A0A7J6V2Y7_THATH|nr:hypothetical protein FRX31_031630 [Thalictrum thalictroides]
MVRNCSCNKFTTWSFGNKSVFPVAGFILNVMQYMPDVLELSKPWHHILNLSKSFIELLPELLELLGLVHVLRRKPVQDIDKEIYELKLSVNTRGKLVATVSEAIPLEGLDIISLI